MVDYSTVEKMIKKLYSSNENFPNAINIRKPNGNSDKSSFDIEDIEDDSGIEVHNFIDQHDSDEEKLIQPANGILQTLEKDYENQGQTETVN